MSISQSLKLDASQCMPYVQLFSYNKLLKSTKLPLRQLSNLIIMIPEYSCSLQLSTINNLKNFPDSKLYCKTAAGCVLRFEYEQRLKFDYLGAAF